MPRLQSFDGGVEIEADVRVAGEPPGASGGNGARIARGAGLSYAALSFGQGATVVDHTSRNRILAFDPATGRLEVEAGVRLGQVYDEITRHGWFLPIQPGHPRITIGGCIAADVHGKNQARDGTFESLVQGLTLFHPDHGTLALLRGDEVFELTCGGFGLTGEILRATIQTKRLPSARIVTRVDRLDDIRQLPQRFAALDADLLYSWHDFSATGDRFGRGFVVVGTFEPGQQAPPSEARSGHARSALSADQRGRWLVPCFNRATTRPFNALFRRASLRRSRGKAVELFDFLFPVHDKEAYFRLFGRRGFHEQQLIVPNDRWPAFVDGVRDAVRATAAPITLASGKRFEGRPRLLRFTGQGLAFALDFPRTSRGAKLAARIDSLAVELGAIPNIAKDSRLSRRVVEATFAELDVFRQRLEAFDPHARYQSEVRSRLGL